MKKNLKKKEPNIFMIGLTGENAAGKGLAAKILEDMYSSYNVVYCNTRDLVLRIAKKKNINIKDRRQISVFSNEYTATYGGDIYCYDFFQEIQQKGKTAILIMDSIRRVDEARFINRNDGLIISVTAPTEKRFQWAKKRRTITDNVKTLEEYIALDYAENSPLTSQLNLAETMKHANVHFQNNGTIDEFISQVKSILPTFMEPKIAYHDLESNEPTVTVANGVLIES